MIDNNKLNRETDFIEEFISGYLIQRGELLMSSCIKSLVEHLSPNDISNGFTRWASTIRLIGIDLHVLFGIEEKSLKFIPTLRFRFYRRVPMLCMLVNFFFSKSFLNCLEKSCKS